jgi:mono/diheme cytochrome c family protein
VKSSHRRTVSWMALATGVGLLAIQLVPYGRAHTNPPVRAEPRWNAPRTRQLAVRACFDCHSNETRWPWYSHVAPMSWLTQRDVDEGRAKVNFSEWTRPPEEASESAKSIREGAMPPWYYPWARLSSAEKEELAQGLAATVGEKASGDERDGH